MLKLAVLVSGGGTNLRRSLMRSAQERLQMRAFRLSSVIMQMPMPWSVRGHMESKHCASHRKILKAERLLIRHSLIN